MSFPKIQQRLTAIDAPAAEKGRLRRPNPWHQATATIERSPHRLEHSANDAANQAHIAALGETLDALPLLAPQDLRPQLRQTAYVFERATRSRIQAEHHHARALRGAVRAMRTQPVTGDGSGLAMLLDAAILAVIATARWHQLRQHDQQVIAARQTLAHLQAAYEQAAAAPLAALAQLQPPAKDIERLAQHVRAIIPEHAEQMLDDPAWPVLATALSEAETAGHDPQRLLQQAADQRALDDAQSPTRALTWRIERLGRRQALSARARAAQTRSAQPVTDPAACSVPVVIHAIREGQGPAEITNLPARRRIPAGR